MNPVGKVGGVDLFSAVRGASRAVTQAFDDAVRPFGLRATQYGVLKVVQRLGEATIQEIALSALVDGTTATRALQVLQTGGYIKVVEGTDRRQRVVSLSGHGRKIIEKANSSWQAVEDQMRGSFGQDRLPPLIAGLLRLTEVAQTER